MKVQSLFFDFFDFYLCLFFILYLNINDMVNSSLWGYFADWPNCYNLETSP